MERMCRSYNSFVKVLKMAIKSTILEVLIPDIDTLGVICLEIKTKHDFSQHNFPKNPSLPLLYTGGMH